MYRLLQLIHSYRAFLLLLFLEVVCLWLLVRNNPYHSAAYFHTSNALIGEIFATKTGVSQYFGLPEVNAELANDNALLRESLAKSQVPVIVNSQEDSLSLVKGMYTYEYLAAKVINNSTGLSHNFLTVNKGKKNGIEPGMGVISSKGVVGKVMSVSQNFSTIASLLNLNVFVSAYLKRNNTFCTVNWGGKDILKAKLMYVPRHIELQLGDTIVTSGYNSVFPENIMIGFVEEINLKENEAFYDIDVSLSNDFSRLAYVYIIKNPLKEEQTELEAELIQGNE